MPEDSVKDNVISLVIKNLVPVIEAFKPWNNKHLNYPETKDVR